VILAQPFLGSLTQCRVVIGGIVYLRLVHFERMNSTKQTDGQRDKVQRLKRPPGGGAHNMNFLSRFNFEHVTIDD